jgi:hypothetical protein
VGRSRSSCHEARERSKRSMAIRIGFNTPDGV